jgi:hypothetical protein
MPACTLYGTADHLLYYILYIQFTVLSGRSESNPSVARYKENTEKICSILRTSILGLFLGPLVIWPKVGEHTELLRISKEWRRLRCSSYLPIYLPTY